MKKRKNIYLASLLSFCMIAQSVNLTAFAGSIKFQGDPIISQESMLETGPKATSSDTTKPDISTDSNVQNPVIASDANAGNLGLMQDKADTIPILSYLKGVEHSVNKGSGYFDASEDVTKIKDLDELTLTMEFKTSNTDLQSIFNVGSPGKSINYFCLYLSGSKVGIECRDGITNPSMSSTTKSIADNNYHSISVSYKRSEYYKIYLDGLLVFDITEGVVIDKFLNNLGIDPTAMTFGSLTRGSGNEYPFTGTIKNINIYDSALSEKEILEQHGVYDVLEDGPILSEEELKFTGTELVDLSDQMEDLADLDQATIHARFRLSDFSNSDSGLMTLFSVSNKAQDQTYATFYVKPNENKIGMELKNKEIKLSTNPSIKLSDENSLNDKEWHTASYVFNKKLGTWSIYLDGLLCGSGSYTGLFSSMEGANAIRIGSLTRTRGDNTWVFKGNIDLLEIYDKPFSQSDIDLLHDTTKRDEIDLELPESATKTEPVNLFYAGYDGSKSYRIPSILTTESGVVIAAIDKRQSGAADEGNIDGVIRRSLDDGDTWEEPQVLIDNPVGSTRASFVIDASMLQDKGNGRVFFLIDMFPESRAIMQPSLLVGGSGYKTVNEKKYLILKNYENNDTNKFTKEYTVREEGKVWLESAAEGGVATLTEYSLPNFSTGELFKNETTPAGNIFLFSGSNAGELKVMRTSYLWMVHSDDDGETWSEPYDITGQVKEEWMTFIGTGPGVGIQIEKGVHAGRLVFPIYHTNSIIGGSQSSAVIYSDDNGETWQLGESPNLARGIDPKTMNNSGQMLTEAQVVEVGNEGRLKIFMRNGNDFVFMATSDDGGETWSNLYQDKALIDKYCQMTVIKYPELLELDGEERQPYIFANPVGPSGRENGTVRIGYYNEATDSFTWPYKQLVHAGEYAYSCLTALADGDIGLFYEANVPNMKFTKFSPDWVMAPRTKPMGIPEIENVEMKQEGNILTFDVSFDQAMMVVGKPVLKLNIDGKEVVAPYVEGRSTNKLKFQYSLQDENAKSVTAINVAATGTNEIGGIRNELPEDVAIKFTLGDYVVVEEKLISEEAITLDGTEIKNLSDKVGALSQTRETTINARFRVENLENGFSGIMSLFSVSNNKENQTYASFYIKPSTNTIGMEIKNKDTVVANPSVKIEDISFSDKEWHTVSYVINYNLKKWNIYLDGVSCGSGDISSYLSSMEGLNTARIGSLSRLTNDNMWTFNGTIDSLEVYSIPQSKEEIGELHKLTKRGEIKLDLPDTAVKTEPEKLFYKDYAGSVSYRIPAILTTKSGVVLAGIDKRQWGAGDAGNIDGVIRRSLDNGKTWSDPITLIDTPVGKDRSSFVIDASMVQSRQTGRIFFLIDMFPESSGLMDSKLIEGGSGYKTVDGTSYLILRNYENSDANQYTQEYTVRENGKIFMESANEGGTAVETEYTLPNFSKGNLFKNGVAAGNIFLFSGTNAGELKVVRTSYLWMVHSDDDGATWSEPYDITGQVKEEWMYFLGTGPGVGIEIEHGEHAGRLVYPIYHSNINIGGSQSSAVIYSDDNGDTWQLGKSPNLARGIDPETMDNSWFMLTEAQVVEVGNKGRLKIFMRNTNGLVYMATSDDGGVTWSNLYKDTELYDSYCQMTVIKYPELVEFDGVKRQPYIFANPAAEKRTNGTVRIGFYNEADDTFTWPYKQLVHSGNYAYSCLTALADGNIGLFFEGNVPDMWLTIFNIDWIIAPKSKQLGNPEISKITMERSGDVLTFNVKYDQQMMVIGTPVLKLEVDGKEVFAEYVEGNTQKNIKFKYTLENLDAKTVIAINAISSNKGEIESVTSEKTKDVSYSFELRSDHDFTGREEIILEPDCTTEGSKRVYCTEEGCKEFIIVSIPALGHNFSDWVITKYPTKTETGERKKVCKLCGFAITETIPMLPADPDPDPNPDPDPTPNPKPSSDSSDTAKQSSNVSGNWESGENGWSFKKEDGSLLTNDWGFINGNWYYFGDNGTMTNGWNNIGGNWYFMAGSGAMETDWAKDGDTWYYLSNNGAMETGWIQYKTGWFFLSDSGAMSTGWKSEGDSWYYLNSDGLMATNCEIDGYKIDKNGVMK